MANTWIKLYHEILTDPKMGRMPDRLFRRTIELFLIAGKEDQGGMLPPVEDIAWMLRSTDKEIQKTLEDLEALNIIEKTDQGYHVTHFVTRQESNLSGYEKVKRYRDNKSKVINDNPNDNQSKVINDNQDDNRNDIEMITPDKDKDIDKEIDIDKEKDKEEEKSIKRASKKSETKKVYGSHQNVLLTDDEYRKLCERFPDADGKIEALSLGIASKGYKYKDHYATILNWARMDAEKTPQNKPPETTFGDIRGFFESSEPEWDIEI